MDFINMLSTRRDAASSNELEQLNKLVASVPSELVDFLESSNGGVLDPNNFAIATPWGGRHITLDQFWPITQRTPAGNSIMRATQALRNEGMFAPQVLAIAGDTGASVICMSCESDSFGHIYLWDDTRAHPNTSPIETLATIADYMAPIAESLREFADMMTDETTARASAADLAPTGVIQTNHTTAESTKKAPWVAPASLREATSAAEVYLYRHKSGQPDVVLPRSLELAKSNSGHALAPSWETPQVRWLRPDTNTVDLLDAGGLLLLRPRAREAIGELLETFGELLPVETDTGPLFAFRCLNVIDALAPHVHLIEGKNGYVDISAYEFNSDVLPGSAIFTLVQQPTKPHVFFTRAIVDSILASDLRSLDFTKV